MVLVLQFNRLFQSNLLSLVTFNTASYIYLVNPYHTGTLTADYW